MRRKINVIITIAALCALFTACSKTDTQTATTQAETTQAETTQIETTQAAETEIQTIRQEETTNNELSVNDEVVIDSCIQLLGKTDEECKELIPDSEENLGAAGDSLIGRHFDIDLFGETVNMGTLYDAEGLVYIETSQLEDEDAAKYNDILHEIYGEPAENTEGSPSESGTTYCMWEVDNAKIYLYQGYGYVSFEIKDQV